MPARVLYLGTADLACPPLAALHASTVAEVVGVVTQPDRPSGRKLQPKSSPVKQCALDLGLPILQPPTLRSEEALGKLAAFKPDLLVVTAYGQILPQSVLDLPTHGAVNVHASILPRHRGAAPIQWAILEGDPETGVTLMQMDAGLDTGGILDVARIAIGPNDTAQILHDQLARMGATRLVHCLPDYLDGSLVPVPQDEARATYARKISKQDGAIHWGETAASILLKLRAFTPWPGIYTRLPVAKRSQLKIIRAVSSDASGAAGEVLSVDENSITIACGTGALIIQVVQREGGKPLAAGAFLNGCPLKPGQILG